MDDPDFFNTSVRITVISYILERERYGDEDQDKGIKRLIAEDVYKAAYPLHDVSRVIVKLILTDRVSLRLIQIF